MFFSFWIIGCSPMQDEAKSEETKVDNKTDEKRTEMIDSGIIHYMERMTGKYLLADIYEIGSQDHQKALDEALTEVNLAVLDLEAEYKKDIPVVKDLNDLADSVVFAINEMLAGEYSTRAENSQKIGYLVGEISRNYADGELPASIRIHTGMESAFE